LGARSGGAEGEGEGAGQARAAEKKGRREREREGEGKEKENGKKKKRKRKKEGREIKRERERGGASSSALIAAAVGHAWRLGARERDARVEGKNRVLDTGVGTSFFGNREIGTGRFPESWG